MTFKTYEINVDLVNDTSTTYSNRFSQNDRNSAKLLVTITNKGAEIDLSQAKSVRMSFEKPDGTRVFQNDCQPINAMKGKYQIVLKTQTLTSVGTVIAQIHIEEEDRIIDTQKFFFVVNDSLASDEAVESTNEFTIIQKAIEAGKKLEGVDINEIIKAGEKADAALPKSGGMMTGHLIFAQDKGIYFRDAANLSKSTFYGDASGLIFRDLANNSNIFIYNYASKTFDVVAPNTNLLKKTGDTVTGQMTYTNSSPISYRPAGQNWWLQIASAAGLEFNPSTTADTADWNWGRAFIMNKNGVLDVEGLNVRGTNTNLMKKTGDTFTGTVTFGNGNAQIIKYGPTRKSWLLHHPDGNSLIFAPENAPNSGVWDWSKGIEFKDDGIIKMAKDGRAELTLTADATNSNPSAPPIVIRRGNTATIRMEVRQNSGSVATTLPVDMRPTDQLPLTFISNDGAAVSVVIETDGRVQIYTTGKATRIVTTYVVN